MDTFISTQPNVSRQLKWYPLKNDQFFGENDSETQAIDK